MISGRKSAFDNTKVVTIKIPENIIAIIDEFTKDKKYYTRSDFIRDAIEYYIHLLTTKSIFSYPHN